MIEKGNFKATTKIFKHITKQVSKWWEYMSYNSVFLFFVRELYFFHHAVLITFYVLAWKNVILLMQENASGISNNIEVRKRKHDRWAKWDRDGTHNTDHRNS